MANKTRIVVTGVSGRMGRMLIKMIYESKTVELHGALERKGHAWIGKDLGTLLGGGEKGILVSDNPSDAFPNAHAVVDFTLPDATVAFAHEAARQGIAHVIGTTGSTEDHLSDIKKAAEKIAIVRAGNMSLGVNLLVKLTRQVAAALDADFDIEVIEAHHNKKIDAPSGTALMLGEAAAEGRGVALQDVRDTNRDGIVGTRKKGDIGFVAIRGGDIVGEHDVMFASPAERIILRHVAESRDVFARGALKAAEWVRTQTPGEYDMFDVLGLN